MGKGGGGQTTVQSNDLPEYVDTAAQQNINVANQIARLGYTPYQGPTVAGFSPQQMNSFQSTNSAAQAFGLPNVSNTNSQGRTLSPSELASALTGMPAPNVQSGEYSGYNGVGLARNAIAQMSPAQQALINSLFMNPQTGAQPSNPAVQPVGSMAGFNPLTPPTGQTAQPQNPAIGPNPFSPPPPPALIPPPAAPAPVVVQQPTAQQPAQQAPINSPIFQQDPFHVGPATKGDRGEPGPGGSPVSGNTGASSGVSNSGGASGSPSTPSSNSGPNSTPSTTGFGGVFGNDVANGPLGKAADFVGDALGMHPGVAAALGIGRALGMVGEDESALSAVANSALGRALGLTGGDPSRSASAPRSSPAPRGKPDRAGDNSYGGGPASGGGGERGGFGDRDGHGGAGPGPGTGGLY